MNNVPQDLKRQSASLQRLADEGKKLAHELKGLHSQEEVLTAYHSWFQRVITCLSPLQSALGQDNLADKMESLRPTSESVAIISGKIRGIYLSIEKGELNSLAYRIQKRDSQDLLSQAERYLSGTETEIKGEYLAAMYAAIGLEHAVRRLCERQGLIAEDGKWVSLGDLLKKLSSEKIITSEPMLRQLELWKTIRNNVAHGKFETIERSVVVSMIEGIKQFVSDYL